ncbi:V-type ATP synthase subunit E [Halolamina salifodinae]|uniref:A-type ATP synthase subunit E n=1 Tax=Halolamina salifodinae TaxID=1202767 RepID=A0A8T4GXS3_9EURY|nr:V-type ATP synthase subunit E [Halolamina salifodinae]MBP1986384.1 V/A-type H+-transporting ATPase subunit E [Halolamina salifodinae]
MSLETVVEDVRDEARARAEEIRETGESRAEEIISEAEADAESIVQQREEEVEAQIEEEREQALSSAKLTAKQERLEARRDALEQVRDGLEERVAEIEGERREELTRSLLDNAAEEFDAAASVDVYGRAADEELLTDLLSEYEGWSFAGIEDCLGGVVVESESSRVSVDNTFDSVIEEVWDEELKRISERLFEE